MSVSWIFLSFVLTIFTSSTPAFLELFLQAVDVKFNETLSKHVRCQIFLFCAAREGVDNTGKEKRNISRPRQETSNCITKLLSRHRREHTHTQTHTSTINSMACLWMSIMTINADKQTVCYAQYANSNWESTYNKSWLRFMTRKQRRPQRWATPAQSSWGWAERFMLLI